MNEIEIFKLGVLILSPIFMSYIIYDLIKMYCIHRARVSSDPKYEAIELLSRACNLILTNKSIETSSKVKMVESICKSINCIDKGVITFVDDGDLY